MYANCWEKSFCYQHARTELLKLLNYLAILHTNKAGKTAVDNLLTEESTYWNIEKDSTVKLQKENNEIVKKHNLKKKYRTKRNKKWQPKPYMPIRPTV